MFRAVLLSYSSKSVFTGSAAISVGFHAAVLAAAVAGGSMGADDPEDGPSTEQVTAVFLAPYPSEWRSPPPVAQVLHWQGQGEGAGDDAGAGADHEGATGAEAGTGDPTAGVDVAGGLSIPLDALRTFLEKSSDSVYFGYQVDNPAAFDATSAAPVYPDSLRVQGIEGEVLAQFVVDTTGTVERGSFVLLSATHRLFTQSVQQALPGMHFRPAELNGQRIRQLVQVPFVFRLASLRADSTDSGSVAQRPPGGAPDASAIPDDSAIPPPR